MPAEQGAESPSLESAGDLLDRAPCGFLSFRDDGRIELVNTTLLNMLGYDRPHLVGRHVENILTVATRIFYQTHWFPLLRLHGRAEEVFLMVLSQAGEEIGVLANAVRRVRGNRAAYDCVFMRVRERQKYEDQLVRARQAAERANAELQQQQQRLHDQAVELEAASEELRTANDELLERSRELERLRTVADEANHAKSAFLAIMSHELRTPLNAIAGYVEILEMGIHGPVTDTQKESLARIKRSQRHLLRLINDILNLSRIESGHVDYQNSDIALVEVVREVKPMVEPQLAEKDISFHTRVRRDVAVHADRDKVQQILINLLSNAIKFTPPGGRITVASAVPEDAPDMAQLCVTDTGIGIPATQLDTIFDPFVQVDISNTKKDGSGLGLAISRDLARGMGGDLTVESAEGDGSTFTLQLRRALDH